jgi:threonine dehydrogenase-like Zn-dependent dehydrogenase
MSVGYGGNVGIGTTTPGGAKLVVESSTAPQLLLKNSAGANAQIVFEDDSGLTQNAKITYDQGGQNALYITTGYVSTNDTNKIFLQPGGSTAMTLFGGDNSTGNNGSVEITKHLTVGGSITETSAKRFKENIKTLDSQVGNIGKLNPVSFDWKDGGKSDIGFIAEEVKEVYPDLVSEKEGKIQGVQYTKLTAVLVKAIQDQQKQIDELKKEIFILKKK